MKTSSKLASRRLQFLFPFCFAVAIFGISGCADSDTPPEAKTAEAVDHDDHGHDHGAGAHPETFEEAVKAVTDIDETIKTAFAAGDKDAAHGPLHQVGHVLEELNGLAAKSEMTDEQRDSVKTAVEKLFEAFGAVDETMHGDGSKGKPYEDVASEIEESLKVLAAACSKEAVEG